MPNIKDLIKYSHEAAEKNPLNQKFINGTIEDSHYNLYMGQRFLIAQKLDGFLPDEFKRASFFLMDFGNDLPEVLTSTWEYLNYIDSLSDELIISQIYVNYMGDLFGGQIIKRNNPNRDNHHLNFTPELKSSFVSFIRNEMLNRDEELAPYADRAFEFLNNILNEVADEYP